MPCLWWWTSSRRIPSEDGVARGSGTSNAFTADGSDGHFDWCIRQLTAPDITTALHL